MAEHFPISHSSKHGIYEQRMVLLVISPLNYSDEKTSLLNGNVALCIQITIVFRIAFVAPFFLPPLDLILIKDVIYTQGADHIRRPCCRGCGGLWSVCPGTASPRACPPSELPSSCVIVLTSVHSFMEQLGLCQPAEARHPRWQSPVPLSCWWL